MKRLFKPKHRKNSNNFIFLLLMTGVTVILFFAYSSTFPFMKPHENTYINLFDDSEDRENPSVKISINNKTVYQTDSITEADFTNPMINLTKGKHFITISTANDEYTITDTIEVKRYHSYHFLSINYNHTPTFNQYKSCMLRIIYRNRIKRSNYNTDQKKELYNRLHNMIEKTYRDSSRYYQDKQRFTFTFNDIKNIL